MLVANIDGSIVALASDQRAAALLLVKNCALVPARNAQGSTYYFDLGAGVSGTGVGCSQVAGTQGRSLVGLKLIRDSSGTTPSRPPARKAPPQPPQRSKSAAATSPWPPTESTAVDSPRSMVT